MHQATRTNIIGHLSVIRQSMLCIEAAIAADDHQPAMQASKKPTSSLSLDPDSTVLSDAEEDALGVMLGLVEAPEEKPKKTAKKS